MKLFEHIEHKLRDEVLAILESGRAGWDGPHTLAVVHWMKKLIEKEGGSEKVLVTAAYLHDIGYSKLDNLSDYDSIKKMKKAHMTIGAEISRDLLEAYDFTSDEKNEIVHLVLVHDEVETLTTHNEILLMEADSLAQIDFKRVKSTFKEDDKRAVLAKFMTKRASRFKTKTGKEFLSILLPKIQKEYGLE